MCLLWLVQKCPHYCHQQQKSHCQQRSSPIVVVVVVAPAAAGGVRRAAQVRGTNADAIILTGENCRMIKMQVPIQLYSQDFLDTQKRSQLLKLTCMLLSHRR